MSFTISSQPRVPFFVTADEPTSPITGDFWFDSDTNVLYQYNGSAFIAVAPNNVYLISSTAITNATTYSATGLSTTAYRYYMLLVDITPDAGTPTVSMTLNNVGTNNYITRSIDGASRAIIESSATGSFQIVNSSQGVNAQILIPVNRVSTNYTNVIANTSDVNIGTADLMISGRCAAAGASISRIDLAMSGNCTGKVNLYGVQ